ncbi:MAG: hypothetical protein REI09_11165 [Candidatus Dactylopiibacterium sp.]|nr:hypothetical protein [Candidatus Dactylopiibacterium sp.]
MALHHTLGAIQLPAGMTWDDEFDWSPVVKSLEYSLTGAAVIQAARRLAGRPITLAASDDQGWKGMTREKLQALYALAAVPSATYILSLADGRSFTVAFAAEEPISARPLFRHEAPPADWPYVVTLKFMEL